MNHTRRLHNPLLPSYFISLISSAAFLSVFHFSCIQNMYQKPPNNNLLAEAAVTQKELNDSCPSLLHRPSSIIQISQDGKKRSLWLFVPKCSTHPLLDVPQIDHKITVSNGIPVCPVNHELSQTSAEDCSQTVQPWRNKTLYLQVQQGNSSL